MKLKYAIVTGGSRGIGSAICKKIAEDTDYHILINYQSNKDAALATLEEVRKVGGNGEIIQFDVANHQEVTEVLTQWQENNPEEVVEVIVNSAVITKDGLFMWLPQQDRN